MGWLTTARRELVGLFVDDGSFAFAILAWVVGGFICFRLFEVPPIVEGFVFAAGLAFLLAENVARSARGGRP